MSLRVKYMTISPILIRSSPILLPNLPSLIRTPPRFSKATTTKSGTFFTNIYPTTLSETNKSTTFIKYGHELVAAIHNIFPGFAFWGHFILSQFQNWLWVCSTQVRQKWKSALLFNTGGGAVEEGAIIILAVFVFIHDKIWKTSHSPMLSYWKLT